MSNAEIGLATVILVLGAIKLVLITLLVYVFFYGNVFPKGTFGLIVFLTALYCLVPKFTLDMKKIQESQNTQVVNCED